MTFVPRLRCYGLYSDLLHYGTHSVTTLGLTRCGTTISLPFDSTRAVPLRGGHVYVRYVHTRVPFSITCSRPHIFTHTLHLPPARLGPLRTTTCTHAHHYLRYHAATLRDGYATPHSATRVTHDFTHRVSPALPFTVPATPPPFWFLPSRTLRSHLCLVPHRYTQSVLDLPCRVPGFSHAATHTTWRCSVTYAAHLHACRSHVPRSFTWMHVPIFTLSHVRSFCWTFCSSVGLVVFTFPFLPDTLLRSPLMPFTTVGCPTFDTYTFSRAFTALYDSFAPIFVVGGTFGVVLFGCLIDDLIVLLLLFDFLICPVESAGSTGYIRYTTCNLMPIAICCLPIYTHTTTTVTLLLLLPA